MRGKRSIALASALLAVQLFSTAVPTLAAGAEKSLEYENKNCISEENCECAALRDDAEVSSRFLELLFGKKKKPEAHINKEEKQESKTELTLCPGGDVFGIKIAKDSVSVTAADEECGLKYGDIIISIGGKRIRSLSDVKSVLESSDGSPLDLVIERGGSKVEAKIIPKKSDGTYTLGATLKDGVAGIGTVTYFNPKTSEFGGLGHAICEPKTSDPVKMKKGLVNGVVLGSADKSTPGKPGELTGILTEDVLGELYSNTTVGVFGKFNTPPDLSRKMLPVGKKSDVREGEAMIYSTVKNGHRDEYKVEIFDIDRTSDGPKSFKIRVTDEALKALTGGIVRGMSGSPIIQDGKLIGAVTHVLVANPTEGYGIFIENMLNAAQMPQARAA